MCRRFHGIHAQTELILELFPVLFRSEHLVISSVSISVACDDSEIPNATKRAAYIASWLFIFCPILVLNIVPFRKNGASSVHSSVHCLIPNDFRIMFSISTFRYRSSFNSTLPYCNILIQMELKEPGSQTKLLYKSTNFEQPRRHIRTPASDLRRQSMATASFPRCPASFEEST